MAISGVILYDFLMKYNIYEMVINYKLKYILVCRCDGCDGLMVI